MRVENKPGLERPQILHVLEIKLQIEAGRRHRGEGWIAGAVDETERFAGKKPPGLGIKDSDVVAGVAGGTNDEKLAAAQGKAVTVTNYLQARLGDRQYRAESSLEVITESHPGAPN